MNFINRKAIKRKKEEKGGRQFFIEKVACPLF